MSSPLRSQTSIEYVMILGGVLLIVSLFAYFLLNTVYAPQTADLENKSKEYKDLKGQLNDQLGDLDGSEQPGPSPSPAG
ncbi:class III signal peptide-containing protein [Candidatus Micrarchaeota archaeon]|nr:class III signal peptide-containing protein [Candidatus Micrarchaeota archaeon]